MRLLPRRTIGIPSTAAMTAAARNGQLGSPPSMGVAMRSAIAAPMGTWLYRPEKIVVAGNSAAHSDRLVGPVIV